MDSFSYFFFQFSICETETLILKQLTERVSVYVFCDSSKKSFAKKFSDLCAK